MFGLADRWAKTFEEVAAAAAAAGVSVASPTWYVGNWGTGGFSDVASSMDSFSTVAAGTFVSTPGSSGSSGFSGGGGFSGRGLPDRAHPVFVRAGLAPGAARRTRRGGTGRRIPMIDLVLWAPVMAGGALAGASSGVLGTFIVGMRIPFLGVCVAHAALAGGGGEELSFVEFTPGTTNLVEGELDKLGKLATALAKRPALNLEIEGGVDPGRDGTALARTRLGEQLKAKRLEELTARGRAPEAVETFQIEPEERARLLRTAARTPRGIVSASRSRSDGDSRPARRALRSGRALTATSAQQLISAPPA